MSKGLFDINDSETTRKMSIFLVELIETTIDKDSRFALKLVMGIFGSFEDFKKLLNLRVT